ncbi:glycosyltransferase [Amphritea atlantica]|uniref:Glycosyltransferase n=1 Tax=Amphritea atlantica TaxID=355243 RepID=A0ABY5GRZ6_9GAMM|nr:glycosyltransferase [Amphritea atlantica]
MTLEKDRELDSNGVDVSCLSNSEKKQSSIFLWLRAILNSKSLSKELRDSKVVLVYLERALVCTVLASFFLKEKPRIVVNVESDLKHKYGKYGFFSKIVLSFFYRFANDVVFKTAGSSKSFFSFLPNVKAAVHIVNNPVLLSEVGGSDKVDCRMKGFKNILVAGRLHPTKGVWFSIYLYSELIKLDRCYKLLIAGDGVERDSLMMYASSLGLRVGCSAIESMKEVDVLFLGQVSNMADLYQQSDVFLSNSYSESFGLTILESIVNGVPVVVSDFGGVLDEVDSQYIKVLGLTPKNSAGVGDIDPWLSAIKFYSNTRVSSHCIDSFKAGFSDDKYKLNMGRLLSI